MCLIFVICAIKQIAGWELPVNSNGYVYPLVNIQKGIENGHRNSGFYPLKMVIFL